MSHPRLRQLLERELDGDLTPVERAELERFISGDPSLRREREGWKRVSSAMSEGARVSTSFDAARLAANAVSALSEADRSPSVLGSLGRLRFRWWAAALGVVVACGIGLDYRPFGAHEAPKGPPARVADARGTLRVDVVDEPQWADDESEPVAVRF